MDSRRQQTKARLAGEEGEEWARKGTSANSEAVLPYLVCSLTCVQLVLQFNLPSVQPSSLLANRLTFSCQLSTQLAVGSRLRLKKSLSLSELSLLRYQGLQAPLQG